MPKFSGTQKASILLSLSDISTKLDNIELNVFEFSDDISKMYWYDVFIKARITNEFKPFKPENSQLKRDYAFWNRFLQIELKNEFDKADLIDISLVKYQNLTAGINQIIGWCEMVKSSYLANDLLVYQNVFVEKIDLGGFKFDFREYVQEPTANLTDISRLYKQTTLVQGKKQVYFEVEEYRNSLYDVENLLNNILNILNSPTPEKVDKVTGVSIDSTGTKQIIQKILDFSLSVTITFKQVINLIQKGNAFGSYILLYLREDTKKDLNTIIDNTQAIIGGDPNLVGVTSNNEIKYTWLIGSTGDYYPVPATESTDPTNDVYLSANNGIIFSLKRADDNARWRYKRLNDVVYEINTNNNKNKAYLDDLSPRIINIENTINEIEIKNENDADTINQKLALIELKIDKIITKLEIT